MAMQNFKRHSTLAAGSLALATCLVCVTGSALAEGQVAGQDTSAQSGKPATAPPPASGILSDAVVEANVVRALSNSKALAGNNITTTSVFGKVTLTGVVTDEAARELADTLASQAPGVKSVIDNLTIGTPTPPDTSGPDPAAGNVAPAPNAQQEPGVQGTQSANGPWRFPEGGQGEANQPPPQGETAAPAPQLRPQIAGERVVIQGGAAMYVRIMEELDSRHLKAGMPFQGTVLNDIVADDTVAIPRGATVSGVVIQAKHPGFWSGVGSLVLQATSVQMNGQTIPVITYMWAAPNARAYLPAEAIVRFRLERPTTVVTVSQDDLAKLAASVPLLKGVPPESNLQTRRRYNTVNPDPGYTDDDDEY